MSSPSPRVTDTRKQLEANFEQRRKKFIESLELDMAETVDSAQSILSQRVEKETAMYKSTSTSTSHFIREGMAEELEEAVKATSALRVVATEMKKTQAEWEATLLKSRLQLNEMAKDDIVLSLWEKKEAEFYLAQLHFYLNLFEYTNVLDRYLTREFCVAFAIPRDVAAEIVFMFQLLKFLKKNGYSGFACFRQSKSPWLPFQIENRAEMGALVSELQWVRNERLGFVHDGGRMGEEFLSITNCGVGKNILADMLTIHEGLPPEAALYFKNASENEIHDYIKKRG